MKLICTEHGQAFQQFIAEEIHPPSGLYVPDFVRSISERYAFAIGPTNYDTIIKEGAKYREGRFVTEGRTIAIKDLGAFNDGILVVAWNTDESNVIVNDLITWAAQNFGFREPRTKLPRRFVSSVVVEFDAELDGAFTAFSELQKGFSSAIKETYGRDLEISASKVALSADPTKLPPLTTFDFTIERRTGQSFSENRYFSMATLPTALHLDLLTAFERRL